MKQLMITISEWLLSPIVDIKIIITLFIPLEEKINTNYIIYNWKILLFNIEDHFLSRLHGFLRYNSTIILNSYGMIKWFWLWKYLLILILFIWYLRIRNMSIETSYHFLYYFNINTNNYQISWMNQLFIKRAKTVVKPRQVQEIRHFIYLK